jgi:diguanylate cyclase (GGDEF)-like protein/PAS domain S-box-containing protein
MSKAIDVLVIEDVEDDAELVLLRLRQAGYTPRHIRVQSAATVETALRQQPWDIVISDYAMPSFSGLEALRIVRAFDCDLPFILVSGTVGEEFAVEAMRSGANDYILKDNLTRLVPAIDRELREAEDRRKHRQAEKALYEERERALVTLHSIGDGVITTDRDGLVDYVNPVAENISGWTHGEARGRPLTEVLPLISEASRQPMPSPAQACLRSGNVVSLEENVLLVNRRGEEFHIEDSAAPIFNREDEVIGVVLVFHDVTQERRMARQISWQATHDSLTGLSNRGEFDTLLAELIEDSANSQHQHALLYLDLDQFKVVNDTCGHSAGDELLKELSQLLLRHLPENANLARLGGDEFGVLLDNSNIDQSRKIAERILRVVESFQFRWENSSFDISVSIGLVPISGDGITPSFALSAADVACFVAKESGRRRIHVYQEGDAEHTRHHSEMQWVSRINQAMKENRFELFRQAIVPLQGDSRELHYELLIRLREADGSLVPPGLFIPSAERYNLMNSLDRWVIETAFQYYDQLRQYEPDTAARTRFSINLSGASFNDDSLYAFIRTQLENYSVPTAQICFEITETAAVFNLENASRFIRNMKDMGCRFALDDFGSGLSSFAYLKNLPVDFLKIDGSFVKDMVTDAMDSAIVSAINQVGHVLGIKTIAEFVENDAILARLRDLGVDYAQGYGVGKPEPMPIPAPLAKLAE